jgi:hypothetical protein
MVNAPVDGSIAEENTGDERSCSLHKYNNKNKKKNIFPPESLF